MVRMLYSKGPRTSPCARIFLLAVLLACAQQFVIAKKQPPAKPININTASLKELEELPGVGPTTANAIILFRTRTGRFRRVEDLLAVRGISETKLKNMRRYITLGPPPAPPPPPKRSP